MDFVENLQTEDNDIFGIIGKELKRQQQQIELIASENIVSRAVMEAQGSILTNKYAEGYPNKRYYHGCEFVDEIETLAIESIFAYNFVHNPASSAISIDFKDAIEYTNVLK